MSHFNPLPSNTFYKVTNYHGGQVTDFFGKERETISLEDLKYFAETNPKDNTDFNNAVQHIESHWEDISKLSIDGNEEEGVISINDYKALIARDKDPENLSVDDFKGLGSTQNNPTNRPGYMNSYRQRTNEPVAVYRPAV